MGLRYLLYFVIFSEPHLILIQHTVRGKKFFKDHGKTAEKVCKSFENREFFFFFPVKRISKNSTAFKMYIVQGRILPF